LIILAGGLFALYGDKIRDAWPFQPFRKHPTNWSAFWSWVTAILAALSFFFRQMLDDREKRRAQGRLVQQADQLAELVRTMPPANFLASFAELHRAVDQSATAALGAPNPPFRTDAVERAVRLTLRAIATLAKV